MFVYYVHLLDVLIVHNIHIVLLFYLQNRIDGEKLIQQSPMSGQRKDVDKWTFDNHDVYGMDVMISTGKGQVNK